MNVLPQPVIDLLNKIENPNHRVMAFAVPLRMLRIVATDTTFKTFRVEQLVITNQNPHDPRGNWTTLSTHGSDTPGAAYNDAGTALLEAQTNLRRKLEQQHAKGGNKLLVPA